MRCPGVQSRRSAGEPIEPAGQRKAMSELRKELAFEIRELELTEDRNLIGVVDAAVEAYETARMDGLCHEGAWEVAISAARSLKTNEIHSTET